MRSVKTGFIYIGGAVIISCIVLVFIPLIRFDLSTSTVIEASNGNLLGAKIADDEQWRFPAPDSIPFKFKKSLLVFEDEYFYFHPGVNPFSIVRAGFQNFKAGKVVRGGSTITMQVARMYCQNSKRNVFQKIVEMFLALKLEFVSSKEEILIMHVANAPFGGNVVGLDAASWRYFGRKPHQLSWAESACLAVLPNAPGLIYPGRKNTALLKKRNFLLHKLAQKNIIDAQTLELALMEPLPDKARSIPQFAPHLLHRLGRDNTGEKIRSSIDYDLQRRVNGIIDKHSLQLSANQIFNAACIVINVSANKVVAYVGNTKAKDDRLHGNDVDVIEAYRSSGSILKPLLFASMLNDGELLPTQLIADVPTFMGSYTPKNFNLTYDGAVPAKKALERSLNIPAVRMLSEYGVEKFHYSLRKAGLRSINNAADYYGLSLVLGGAEVSLEEISAVYSGFARTLLHYKQSDRRYFKNDFQRPSFYSKDLYETGQESEKPFYLSAASVYFTFDALLELNRPENETGWEYYSSSKKIAWKTGTSFGFKDAWAVGVSPDYVIGVWVGNADGEGRPGLTGISAAAPVLFDVLDVLPLNKKWFDAPLDECEEIAVCHHSGFRASRYCEKIDTILAPAIGLNTDPCPFHELVHLDSTEMYRVNSACYPPGKMVHKKWFVLPPVMEWYYRQHHPEYMSLPPYLDQCALNAKQNVMEFIYPKSDADIYVPVDLQGNRSEVVIKVAHRFPEKQIFWHLDQKYLGTTQTFHQMPVLEEQGTYKLSLIDEDGNVLERRIRFISEIGK